MKKKDLVNQLFNFVGVILGVLLAFWINEKSIANRERGEARELMQALANDLREDVQSYEEYQIPVNQQHQQQLDSLISAMDSENIERVNKFLPSIFQVQNYVPTASSYNSMKASGKLGLVDNLKLQKHLSDYFDGMVLESSLKSQAQVDYLMEEMLPWVADNADISNMDIQSATELTPLKNRVIIYKLLVDQKVDSYKYIREEAEMLLEQLDSLGALR
ncbi:hypothetical protein SAMN04490243_2583 [Robiginitalea myxolifaciens]|uniref:Uncharacterized protein n=1 Tax=Robiginitalea myxolifaciens TaxID=400055 RepID=A0A1I6HDA8_9FLAO|nr:DUF6090 family protein [Robiginitalea myxolifaciens]SFR52364.1 hypothetical protein SAMN04490243_2583 [Robiginitalea myxolifaciens]